MFTKRNARITIGFTSMVLWVLPVNIATGPKKWEKELKVGNIDCMEGII